MNRKGRNHRSQTPNEGGGGGRGSGLPLKNYKNVGSLINTGPDPLKMTKLPSQHSNLGHDRHANKTPFKWQFVCGPMMAAFSGI